MNIHRIQAVLLVIWISSIAHGQLPVIDGVFSDWNEKHVVAVDDDGDASASFDITKVAATTNGTELYLQFDVGPRTPSVTRIPRTLGGHTMPVGWNWTNSMSTSPAPAS